MQDDQKPTNQTEIIHNQDQEFDGTNPNALDRLTQKNPVNPNDFYKDLLGENVYNFYFSHAATQSKDGSIAVQELLADCVSKDHWNSFLQKHKDGEVTTEELLDVILISHLHAVEKANPVASAEEIMDRAVESKVKGKLGRKLITSVVQTLSTANLLTVAPDAAKALLSYNLNKSDERATNSDDVKFLPTAVQKDTEKLADACDKSYDIFLNSFNVSDLVRDITMDELLTRLNTPDDPYFGITHQIIFDIGWESVSRKRPEDKALAVYVCELDKAWTDTLQSNVKDSDRHMTRYLVRDVKKNELDKISAIKDAIFACYQSRFEEKIEFFKHIWSREDNTQ